MSSTNIAGKEFVNDLHMIHIKSEKTEVHFVNQRNKENHSKVILLLID